jgi:hypothetical protein
MLLSLKRNKGMLPLPVAHLSLDFVLSKDPDTFSGELDNPGNTISPMIFIK